METTFLAASIAGLLLTVNAWARPHRGITLTIPVFFAGWVTGELAPLLLVFHVLGVTWFVSEGALAGWQGWVALGLSAGTFVGLGLIVRESLRVADVLEEALRSGLGAGYRSVLESRAPYRERLRWGSLAMPFWFRHRLVKRVRGLRYGPARLRNRLDVYHPRAGTSGAPVLFYVHGGGWSPVSNKNHQGKPLMLHLASRGWVCVSANYRVSPRVAFPEHLMDVKRALAWVRSNVATYGGDPSFVVIAGGSAGGHLSALMALTPNDPGFQPGFEEADTSIQACVPSYGVYDFTPDSGTKMATARLWFLERYVIKKRLDEHRHVFEQASPLFRVHAEAPPFFVIHGEHDSLVPVEEARAFVSRLREVSSSQVVYAELARTQHAFDVFHSIRTHHVIGAIERFCDWVYARERTTPATGAPVSAEDAAATPSSGGRDV